MKTLISLLFLSLASFAKAQIVNIPDPNFKSFLLGAGIDTNNDGEIQEAEASAVINLYPQSQHISDLTGIRSFVNLQSLDCRNNQLTSLDVNGMSALKLITCEDNLISTVNLSGCSSLEALICAGNRLTGLNLAGLDSLGWVFCHNNPTLSFLDAHGCAKLARVECGQGNNSLQMVNLADCDSLSLLSLYDSKIGTVDISRCGKIRSLTDLGFIENLIAKDCKNLETIHSGETAPWKVNNFLDVTGCTKLKTIFLQESNLISLDVSTCINLQNLSLPHNGYWFPNTNPVNGLKYLNIKNGSALSTLDIGAWGMPNQNSLNICADEFEIPAVNAVFENAVTNFGAVVNVSSYCSFFPGGSYNTIKGKTQLDLNNNGCDNLDSGMPNVAIKITDTAGNSLVRYTAPSGDYAHYPYKGIFTVAPYFPYPYFTINPSSTSVSFDTANNLIDTSNFCIQPNGVHNDLEISFLPTWQVARPGFDAVYTLTYKNRGTTTLSGDVQVFFANSRMSFTTASEPVTTQNVVGSFGHLAWNYNTLKPFESRIIYVTFTLLPPPVNNIGDSISFISTITPTANDETLFDNNFILPQLLRGAYDPNEKQCLEHSRLDVSQTDHYLHYLINFQNEGTDTAFNIVVADTLSDKLDWNTLELIGSSHPVDVKLTNNKAEFIFQHINLPYKAINETGSHGWLTYQIKPKSSVVSGDSINNSAAIYFDFNPPVITNRVTTLFDSVYILLPVKLEYFSGHTVNSRNQLSWKANASHGSSTFTIERSTDGVHFKSIASITATDTRCQLPFDITDNNPAAGKNYYRLKITDADGIISYSAIVLLGNKKTSLAITAITADIFYLSSNKQQAIQLKIIAADGKEIWNETETIIAGNNNISLQMKSAAKGIYTLVIYTNEGEIITKRFVK